MGRKLTAAKQPSHGVLEPRHSSSACSFVLKKLAPPLDPVGEDAHLPLGRSLYRRLSKDPTASRIAPSVRHTKRTGPRSAQSPRNFSSRSLPCRSCRKRRVPRTNKHRFCSETRCVKRNRCRSRLTQDFESTCCIFRPIL